MIETRTFKYKETTFTMNIVRNSGQLEGGSTSITVFSEKPKYGSVIHFPPAELETKLVEAEQAAKDWADSL